MLEISSLKQKVILPLFSCFKHSTWDHLVSENVFSSYLITFNCKNVTLFLFCFPYSKACRGNSENIFFIFGLHCLLYKLFKTENKVIIKNKRRKYSLKPNCPLEFPLWGLSIEKLIGIVTEKYQTGAKQGLLPTKNVMPAGK